MFVCCTSSTAIAAAAAACGDGGSGASSTTTTLRCRFPGSTGAAAAEVPARLEGGTITCCPPEHVDVEALSYSVLDEHDNCLYTTEQHGGAAPAAAAATGVAADRLAPAACTEMDGCVKILLSEAADLRAPAVAERIRGKRVLYRADLNLPLTDRQQVADDTRLAAVLPTLALLLELQARVVMCSHLGRPAAADAAAKQQGEGGQQQQQRRDCSLAPVAELLQQRLGAAFAGLAPDCVGAAAADAVAALRPGQVCLLENLRFHAGEAANDAGFAQQLAALGDAYVSDAFGVSHRDQASVTGVLPFMAACYPGLLLRSELRYLHSTCNNPARPFGVVIGGAKVKDKMQVLASLITKADVLCIGGRMAFTFLAAAGVAVGSTQIEADWLEPCQQMRQLARERGVQLLLPQDVVVARSLDDDAGCCTVPLTLGCCSAEAPCVPHGCFGLDIGPKTAAAFEAAILSCKTLFWNGPMGRFEVPGFAAGTRAVAEAIGRATAAGATTVIGGGDSVSAVKQLQPVPAVSFMSTGGGASLELIRGTLLPGIQGLAAAVAAEQAV